MVLQSGVSVPSEAVDVVVVGGGIAGLAAALAAAEREYLRLLVASPSNKDKLAETRRLLSLVRMTRDATRPAAPQNNPSE